MTRSRAASAVAPIRLLVLCLAALWAACGSNADPPGDGRAINDLSLSEILPLKLVPGSKLVLRGSFGDVTLPILELDGQFDGQPVSANLVGDLMAPDRIEVPWPGGMAAGFPSDSGTFSGAARVLATGPVDGRLHTSVAKAVDLQVATDLTPQLFGVFEGTIFVNDPIAVEGADFLLGGDEGRTIAIVEGCFTKQGATSCTPVPDVEIPMSAAPPLQRSKATFPFAPKIVGIEPGSFKGTVRLRNDHVAAGTSLETKQIPIDMVLIPPTVFSFSPSKASLGQYVDVAGGGFVGTDPLVEDPTPSVTTLKLDGTFTPTGAPQGAPVNLELIPEFRHGQLVRYVLNEEDALGQLADLRTVTGDFAGTATPTTKYGGVTVTGKPVTVTLGIAPVKQVVQVQFVASYVQSLRHFGLRSVDQRVRDRVFEVLRRDYAGVNTDFRDSEPQDFALFARVDIGGSDPNGLGLLGYDNSPGKDVYCDAGVCIYNRRLYDKIGGVNAVTQEDGYPGYGGVFVESLFGFSKHPGKFAEALEVGDVLFDQIFDPFRPDRGGKPVVAEDLAELNIPILDDSSGCPAKGRAQRIACAVWVLGSLIGTTTSHEVAHSLGLAEPDGSDFHNSGDEPNRLMDSGAARTFRERAELDGQGPAVFCDDEYVYLKKILPTNLPDPVSYRPQCF